MIDNYIIQAIKNDLIAEKSISDKFYDQIYSASLNSISSIHWTPIEVAKRVAQLTSEYRKTSLLDIGSGVGKLCQVASLIKSDIHLTGVEIRQDLFEVSKNVNELFNNSNCHFIHGDALNLDWSQYEILYFFNPFWENKMDSKLRIDSKISISQKNFEEYIEKVIKKLSNLKAGQIIFTYHGFGGRMPSSYECIQYENCGTDQIKIWLKK